MNLNFGREVCNNLQIAESREWLVTNGIGGYASGTISGILSTGNVILQPGDSLTIIASTSDRWSAGEYPKLGEIIRSRKKASRKK